MTTYHSLVRAKERLGYNAKTAEHFIRNAIERGKTADKFHPGKERDWLAKFSESGCRAVAYNGYCFILSEESVCITLYELPHWFGKRTQYCGQERIRNTFKFNKYNSGWAA